MSYVKSKKGASINTLAPYLSDELKATTYGIRLQHRIHLLTPLHFLNCENCE